VSTADLRLDIGEHVVQFYDDDAELVANVCSYMVGAIRGGDVALIVATDAHRRAFLTALHGAGIDVAGAQASGALIALDAADTMARFLTADGPDADAFDAVIGGAIRAAGASDRPVRAYGEMVALLWDAGNVLAALELETLWNDLALRLPFSLFCAYANTSVLGSEHADALRDVCHLHSSVLGSRVPTVREFPAQLASPTAARRFVEDTLDRWGCDDRLIDNAILIVTEMSTNAVVHQGSPFTVTLESHDDAVRVTVQDRSASMPTLRNGALLAESGRGLRLVAAVANRWGAEPADDGKVVWAELLP
jgi:anti-sigma regulatory factor (Ser/Thr protein kinase)